MIWGGTESDLFSYRCDVSPEIGCFLSFKVECERLFLGPFGVYVSKKRV